MPTSSRDADLLDAALKWRDRSAKPDIRGLPSVKIPGVDTVRRLLPDGLAYRSLAAAYAAAVRVSQVQSVLKLANARQLGEMRERPLAECDALARKVASKSGWLAGGSGAALGVAGAAGLVADAPALILVGLRALVRIGYCYGESASPALVVALFALSAADTQEEKRVAWNAALTASSDFDGDHEVADVALRDGLERAAEREFAKQALTGSLQRLGKSMVHRLGVRKGMGLLPVLGVAIGGAVNIRFIYLLGEAARMAFIARRLLADGVPIEKLQLPSPATT